MNAERTLILSSGKCSWAQCVACGWGKLQAPVDLASLKAKMQNANIYNASRLKVFASGSFFDDAQFPREFRKCFADFVKRNKVRELVVESRPEFISRKSLADFKGIKLTVAIGLEAADDAVLKKYKKGFTVADYLKAARVLKQAKCGLRSYLLVNIPFGSQQVLDASVELALKHSDSVVLINTFPHARSELFDLWTAGKWKPFDKKQFAAATKKWGKNKKVELDFQNYLFVPKIPREKQVFLKGASIEVLKHPFFEVWQDFFQRFYEPAKEKDVLVFVPCSFRKPYAKSETHREIARVLAGKKFFQRIHRVVVSTPGVVPFEYCNYYPLNAYDWDERLETPEVMKEYVSVTKNRVKEYLARHKYKKYFCFMKYTETYEAVAAACSELGIKMKNLLSEKTYEKIRKRPNPIIQKEALRELEKNLRL